ncbi:hypothetical protein KP509_19G011300 [Ceratopteris richardii]|nr:hypothetical protein KP509_19G011300 [Ceratopteris richardii]
MGSRPPLCSNKCNACSPCEAVQMPTPLVPSKNRRPEKRVTSAISESHAFFHLDYSNYQPEGWKCKCGNLVYNP